MTTRVEAECSTSSLNLYKFGELKDNPLPAGRGIFLPLLLEICPKSQTKVVQSPFEEIEIQPIVIRA